MSKTLKKRDINKICGRDCQFNKLSDYQEVESGLATSLTDALKTGIVKESDTVLDTNGIDDPETILGVVRDRFDAIDAERAIRKYGKKAQLPAGVSPEPNISADPK